MLRQVRLLSFACATLLLSCGRIWFEAVNASPDGGGSPDGGNDAAGNDASSSIDSGYDANVSIDSGTDASVPIDSGCGPSSSVCRTFTLTIDATQVDATLTDFPVLVRVTNPLLSAARPDGFDLGFSADGGSTQLAFQIERWVQSTGELVAWVKVPSVSDLTDTVFYLSYADGSTTNRSNAASVWSNQFRGVYHMDYGGGAGAQLDSTANANHAAPDTGSCAAAAPVAQTAGLAGPALTFGGDTCDRLIAPDSATLDFANTSQVTMSAWFRMTTAPGYYQIVISKRVRNSGTTNYQFGLDRNTVDIGYFDGPDASAIVKSSPNTTADLNTWTHLAVTVASTSDTTGTCTFFKNGAQIATASGCSLQPNSGPLWLGGLDQFMDEPLLGDLDEVHVSAGERSAAWIHAEYSNQRSSSTFLAVVAN